MTNVQTIGKYNIIRPLGSGGAGDVYLGVDPETSKQVAVKVLRFENCLATDKNDAIRRFSDEVKATLKVSSKYVLRALDWGEDDNKPFIVYEYMEGGNLEDNLKSSGSLSYEIAYEKIIIPMLRGLNALHVKGIVHRDIKPENLFLGDDGCYVIGDCGLASFSDRNAKTKTGLILGTPLYMSPERLTDSSSTPAMDIFAAGAVIVRALTGRLPSDKKNRTSLPIQFVREISAADLLKCHISDQLVPIIFKSLRKETEDRYGSSLEFLSALPEKIALTDGRLSKSGSNRYPKTNRSTKLDRSTKLSRSTQINRPFVKGSLPVDVPVQTSVEHKKENGISFPWRKLFPLLVALAGALIFVLSRQAPEKASSVEYSVQWLEENIHDSKLYGPALSFSREPTVKNLDSFLTAEIEESTQIRSELMTQDHLRNLKTINKILTQGDFQTMIFDAAYERRSGNPSQAITNLVYALSFIESHARDEPDLITGDEIDSYSYILGLLFLELTSREDADDLEKLHQVIVESRMFYSRLRGRKDDHDLSISIGRHISFIATIFLRKERLPANTIRVSDEVLTLCSLIPWGNGTTIFNENFFNRVFSKLKYKPDFRTVSPDDLNSMLDTLLSGSYRKFRDDKEAFAELVDSATRTAIASNFHVNKETKTDIAVILINMERHGWDVTAKSELGFKRDKLKSLRDTAIFSQTIYYFYVACKKQIEVCNVTEKPIEEFLPREFSPGDIGNSLCIALNRIEQMSDSPLEKEAWSYRLMLQMIAIDDYLIDDNLVKEGISPSLSAHLAKMRHSMPFAYYGIRFYNSDKFGTDYSMSDKNVELYSKLCKLGGLPDLGSTDFTWDMSKIPENWFNLALAIIPCRWELMLGNKDSDKKRLIETTNMAKTIDHLLLLPSGQCFAQEFGGRILVSDKEAAKKLLVFALVHKADAELAIHGFVSKESKDKFGWYLKSIRNKDSSWADLLRSKRRLKRDIFDFKPAKINGVQPRR